MLGAQILGGLLSAGKKPKVPVFEVIDANKTQMDTIKGNLDAFPSAQELADKTTMGANNLLVQQLERFMPGLSETSGQIEKNIQSQLRGEIPQDVQNQISRKAASKALQGGFAGSGMSRNLEARDFGMTSYDLTQKGLNSAMSWMSNVRQNATVDPMSASSMFFTPQERLRFAQEERQAKFDVNWMRSQIDAMPDPKRAAIGQAIIKTDDQIMSMASSLLGSAAAGGKI